VLIVPACQIVTEQVAIHLRRYVEEGGTLIVENHLGLFSEHGMQQTPVPPFGLAEVCGLAEDESESTFDSEKPFLFNPLGESHSQAVFRCPTVQMTEPIEADFRARTFVTPLLLTTAGPIGGWKEYCLAAHNHFRQGEVYYFGTCLGRAMFHRDEGAGKIIGAILSQKIKPKVRGKNLRPRLVDTGREALLCVFNDSRSESYTESIAIPDKFNQALDIHTEKTVAVKDGALKVTADREDVVVLYLS
jgi:hypothetical protein